MVSLPNDVTLIGFQEFIKTVYSLTNDRYYGFSDMTNNIQRFTMRSLKGIRKNDFEKTKLNLLIAFSWFVSTLNRFHINLDDEVWNRFPYLCSYCGRSPCSCKADKVEIRKNVIADESKRPTTINQFQEMFEKIYPSENRTIEHAGVHLAEELGELTEAILAYRGERSENDFKNIKKESADFFSCAMGIFNSLKMNFGNELAEKYSSNCHNCHKAPCECSYSYVINYKS